MKREHGTAEALLAILQENCVLTRKDVGTNARLRKRGMTFTTDAYRAEGLGHLCVLRMNAMLGLMKMETVVLAVTEKDVPLLNLDWVSFVGKETQIVELYDTQLSQWLEEAQQAFRTIRERDAALADQARTKEHWYDAILYPCSYHKTGRGVGERLSAAARDYLRAFLEQAKDAPECDEAKKAEKVRAFAERLFQSGGPAVDQVVKLFGEETAKRLILRDMYGISE